jgi:hypothetical protein
VNCLLLLAWLVDSILYLKARAHAAINNYWLSLSVPEQSADLMRSAIIGPDGSPLVSVETPEQVAVVTLDRAAPEFHVALDLARPWRAVFNQGDIYRGRRVDDVRSPTQRVSRPISNGAGMLVRST